MFCCYDNFYVNVVINSVGIYILIVDVCVECDIFVWFCVVCNVVNYIGNGYGFFCWVVSIGGNCK